MAEDIQHFTFTCPAGTPSISAQVSPLSLPPRIVRQVDWRVPNGPMGVMGFLLMMDSIPVLPSHSLTWVIANDETGTWLPTDYPDSGSWQCAMYNTGVNPHSVYLTFHMDLPSRPAQLVPLLAASDIMPAPDLSKAGPPVSRRQ